MPDPLKTAEPPSKLLILATYKDGVSCFVAVHIPMPDNDFLDKADKKLTQAGYEPYLSSVGFYDEHIPPFLLAALTEGLIPTLS